MSFVLLLLISLTTFVQVESTSSRIYLEQEKAKQAAFLGLQKALGELQKAAGPDERITATADLFDTTDNLYANSLTPLPEQEAWLGIWESSTVDKPSTGRAYNPSQPNTRKFFGWLVSATDSAGEFELPTNLNAPASNIAGSGESVVLARRSDGTPYIQAGKVSLETDRNGRTQYAFAVEDEGVKASAGWSESLPDTANPERVQHGRLTAAPGPDYGTLFSNDTRTFNAAPYPLSLHNRGSTSAPLFHISSPTESVLAIANQDSGFFVSDEQRDWLRDQQEHFTAGSRGVLADVQKGGLRRDLSLAFEMDGAADTTATEQPSRFNSQIGEFVGGTDRLAAPQTAIGMPVAARHVYRDRGSLPASQASPFTADIPSSASHPSREAPVVRGPTWWLLRDYANIYKRLQKQGGAFVLDARAYFPNRSALQNSNFGRTYSLGSLMGHPSSNVAGMWDQEEATRQKSDSNVPTDYAFMPARANYSPILLGGACVFSVLVQYERPDPSNPLVQIGDLSVGIDPFFLIWNPFNHSLKVDRLGIALDNGFPGHVTLWKNHATADEERYGPWTMRDYLIASATQNVSDQSNAQEITYLVKDMTMEPGEIIIISPSSTSTAASRLHDQGFEGVNIDNASGVITPWIPESVGGTPGSQNQRIRGKIETVVTASSDPNVDIDTISFLYSNDIGGGFTNNLYALQAFFIDTSLPDAGSEPPDLEYAPNFRVGALGDHLQRLGSNTTLDRVSFNAAVREFYEPALTDQSATPTFDPVGSIGADALSSGITGPKEFFGLVTYLAKPSSSDAPEARPVEMLAQFNPAALSTYSEISRSSTLNHSFQSISESNSINQLLQTAEIGFPAINAERGFWGRANDSGGLTSVPVQNLPTSPPTSLVEFRNASLGYRSGEPFRPVGNSFANVFVNLKSPYGRVGGLFPNWGQVVSSDTSWLLNDALFDRYYLSALAPAFSITGAGYSAQGSMQDSLNLFYGADYQTANANPLLRPHIPKSKSASQIVTELNADDGYLRLGAYAMTEGAFNVNSTSVRAWEALLKSNRNLPIDYADGGNDTNTGTPFTSNSAPSAVTLGREQHWAGLSRLDDSQVNQLAQEIVKQVQLRGPFMSLSDFINRRVGTPINNRTHQAGAIQSAIDAINLNSTVQSTAGGVAPGYNDFSRFFESSVIQNLGSRKTTTGIAGDLTQADILLPLAPRLAARSDTFKIRAYGEVQSPVTGDITRAYCQAIVQRLPEYVNSTANEPWDQASNPYDVGNNQLDSINQQFGRRFTIVSFRWIDPESI